MQTHCGLSMHANDPSGWRKHIHLQAEEIDKLLILRALVCRLRRNGDSDNCL